MVRIMLLFLIINLRVEYQIFVEIVNILWLGKMNNLVIFYMRRKEINIKNFILLGKIINSQLLTSNFMELIWNDYMFNDFIHIKRILN